MAHKPFHLYKVPCKKNPNKYFYYVQSMTKTGTEDRGQVAVKPPRPRQKPGLTNSFESGRIATKSNLTFGRYAENFWVWDKSDYVKGKLARGASMSRNDNVDGIVFCDRCRKNLFSEK